jgi:hypothetical protein
MTYQPQGFRSEELGPAAFRGKGVEDMDRDKEELVRRMRRGGGCPFVLD